MRQAVVIDAVRAPVGRASAENGIYREVRAEDLSAHVIRELVKRTGIEPHLIDDVRWGCVQQQGEQGFDVARTALLMADLPVETGLGRKRDQAAGNSADWNRFEAEALEFHQRVRQGYLELARREPDRWLVVDASGPRDSVAKTIWQAYTRLAG